MTLDITLDDLTVKLGQYKKIGQEYAFQCPYCLDSGRDNLLYNPNKNIFWCHADSTHAPQLMSEIMKEKQPQKKPDGLPQYLLEDGAYWEYWTECNEALLANDKALNYLYEQKQINPFTAKRCGIGYDFEDNKWVFPVWRVDKKLVGYEYRPATFEGKPKCWKEKDTPACMAYVWHNPKQADTLYIVEGFIDGYILAQWMDYPNNIDIVSPSNGVGTVEKHLSEIQTGKYKEVRLCLDNDTEGQKATVALMTKYPWMIDKTPKPTNGKDLRDLYIELVVNNECN